MDFHLQVRLEWARVALHETSWWLFKSQSKRKPFRFHPNFVSRSCHWHVIPSAHRYRTLLERTLNTTSCRESHLLSANLSLLLIAGSMCWACRTPHYDSHTLKKCSGCWKAMYCSAKCQEQHWKVEHKTQCKIFRLVGEETKQTRGITWDEYTKLMVYLPPHCLHQYTLSIFAFYLLTHR